MGGDAIIELPSAASLGILLERNNRGQVVLLVLGLNQQKEVKDYYHQEGLIAGAMQIVQRTWFSRERTRWVKTTFPNLYNKNKAWI